MRFNSVDAPMASPISYDEFDVHEEEMYEEIDEDVENAKPEIEKIILQQEVVTEREVKVRLEKKFFPWITGRTLKAMEHEEIIRRVGYMGRRSRAKRIPKWFFIPYEAKYEDIVGIIEKKRRISIGVNAILTAHAPAGYHAEDLFEQAFESLGFKMHGRNRSRFRGRSVKGKKGKEPPNLDFIIEKDKIVYGVDIKNWIKYEYDTRLKVQSKVRLAIQLGIVPFIIARYVDKETFYVDIVEKEGICYYYESLLVPISYESIAREAHDVLGYPVLAVDFLPNYKVEWIGKLHRDFLKKNRREG